MKRVLAFIIFFVTAVQGFTGKAIFSDSSTVQQKKVDIEFYAIPETTVPARGTIKLTAPSQVTVHTPTACVDQLNGDGNKCTVTVSGKTFTITTVMQLNAGDQFQFKLVAAIDNPESTRPTDSFQLLTSEGESLKDNDMFLTATRGNIVDFTIEPVSKVIGASTDVVLTWKCGNTVPSGSFFQVKFPIWNSGETTLSRQISFLQGSIKCQPEELLSDNVSCTFEKDTLTIAGGVSNSITPLRQIKIRVTGFKNPIDSAVVKGFEITSLVRANNQFYAIDYGVGIFSVQNYAPIMQGSIKVTDPKDPNAGMIQQTDSMTLSFYLPVPLNKGCQVTVVLPSQYSTSTIKRVDSRGVFEFNGIFSLQRGNLQINSAENSFTITPCEKYIENDNLAVIIIDSLMQFKYEKTTDSLGIRIKTESGERVAQVLSGITFLPQRGTAEVTGTASNPVVQSETALTLNLKPQHLVYAQDQVTVQLTFPSEVKVTVCSLIEQPDATCLRDIVNNQVITISNFLKKDYTPGGDPITIKFGQVINPSSVKQEDDFDIQLLAFGKFVIDEYVGVTPWQLTAGAMTGVKVNPGSLQAYKVENTYLINFIPDHSIPKNGFVEIYIPSEVLVPDQSYTQSSCKAPQPQGFPQEAITCVIENYTDQKEGRFLVRVLNAFRRQGGRAGANYVLELPGIQNPIKTMTTGNFIIKTMTQDGFGIDSFEGSPIKMAIEAEIQEVQLIPSHYTNSLKTKFQITMMPSVPLAQNTIVKVTFPDQMIVPTDKQQLTCAVIEDYRHLIGSVSCAVDAKDEQTVNVEMVLKKVTVNGADRLGFTIDGVKNPPTTQTTDSIQVRIVDAKSLATINQKLFGVTMTTNQPYHISKASIKAGSYQSAVSTDYTLEITPEHRIQVGGGVLITVPPQISLNKGSKVKVLVTVAGQTTDQELIYAPYSESARQIRIENVIQGTEFIPSTDRVIQMRIYGFNNPFTDAATDSFEVSTFNKINGMQFFIDTANKGLSHKSLCSYPCNTCVAGQPTQCTSCFESTDQKIGLPYLQRGTCVSECNFGRYYDAQTKSCELCDASCLQCEGSAQNCIACGKTGFPFLYEGKCLRECNQGWLGLSAANKCVKCADQCAECAKTITQCTKCKDRAQSDLSLLYKDTCVASCQPQISVQLGDRCVPCDPICETCSETPTKCTSCKSYMKFDKVALTCLPECKPETQIYNPQDETCDECNPTCTKCQGDVNKCTECKPGFVLNKDFTCQRTCNDEKLKIKQTGVKGVCMDCEEPCQTCKGQTDYCTSCLREPVKYFWHLQQSCLQYCPAKYNVTADDMECEWVGLQCAVNYTADASGNNCVPIYFECAEGFQLNEDLTACVPVPGSPIPFPFLIASIFVSFLVLGSYLKEKFFTKVYTCLISIIGAFEMVMYALIVGLSYNSEEYAIAGLSAVGLVALAISNVAFTFYYQRDIYGKDLVFSKWLFFFPKTRVLIPIFSCFLNFKCSKILYSGFYGMESSMAKFGAPLEYYRIIRMVSYFSFIFCYGFIFIADLLIFARVKWGGQLLILGVETAVLQVLMIVLTYLESKRNPEELLSVGSSQYTTINPKARREIKVMSVAGGQDDYLNDDDDYEEGIPDVDEMQFIRSKEEYQRREVQLRMTAFSKILKSVTKNIHDGVDECQIAQVMTRFDPQQTRVRRAFSMGGKANWSDGEWSSADGDDINSGYLQSDREQDYREDFLRERRFSWPLLTRVQVEIPVVKFENQINEIMLADGEYLLDNCGTELRKVHPNEIQKPKKMVSRRTQTYLRELLYLEGYEQNDSEQSLILDDDAEIDDTYARNLIENVLHNVSGNEAPSDFEEQLHEESLQKLADDNNEAFDLQEIMGQFDVDDIGNFIIVRKANSNDLLDRRGRRVNRRGYLIDRDGNVISQKGQIIFKAIELDEDDEIPAPFDTDFKRGDFKVKNSQPPIQQETQKDFFGAQPLNSQRGVNSNRDNKFGIGKESDNLKDEQKESQVDEQDVADLIDEITKKKVPKARKLMKDTRPSHQMSDNHPPRRFGPGQQSLYPMIGIENSEQRRLAIIADQISGVSQKLAMQNERYHIDRSTDLMPDREHIQRFRQIKQQTVNEIMSGNDSHRHLLNQRPSSVSQERQPKRQRPQTGNQSVNVAGGRRDKPPLNEKFSLQKIYQNIDQLVGLEEQQIQTLNQESRNYQDSRTIEGGRRMGSDIARMKSFEQIYLGRSIQSKPGQKAARPFRPTMQQFDDDPVELTVETGMDGIRFGASAARDVSIMMANQVTQIQRNYQKQTMNLTQRHQQLVMGIAKSSDMDLSEYRVPNAQSTRAQMPQHTVVRHDNWLQ